MQHLLARARWDADAVRDDLRGYVVEQLADPGAVLVVDETGDLKKGTGSAGVQRQYTGTAGRVENCQVAVFLTYAAPAGHALIDRELYVPKSWIADPARCAAAGIPGGTVFATKPKLAQVMLARALDAGTPAGWVAGDEVYGTDPGLCADLEARQIGYVLAVAATHRVASGAGTCQTRHIAARLPTPAWQRYSAGTGAKGHRYYDWAWVTIEAARDKLTLEQADRLRSLLPAPADVVMRATGLHVVVAGALVALAVIGLTGLMVVRLSETAPAVIAAVLPAFAAVLVAVPPIIEALRGR